MEPVNVAPKANTIEHPKCRKKYGSKSRHITMKSDIFLVLTDPKA